MKDDWPVLIPFLFCIGIIVLVVVVLLWSGQDFANRCERANGLLVNYSVCVTKDSTVLMVR